MITASRNAVAAATMAVATLAAPAWAQVADVGGTASVDAQDKVPAANWRFTLGLGAALVPDYVGSDDYEVAVLPKLRAQKGPYYADLTGPLMTSNVLPSDTWQLGPAGQFIKGGRCNSSDNTVNDMRCQSDAFMLGAMAGSRFRLTDDSSLTPRARMLFDVTGANEGFTFEPQLEYARRLSTDWALLLQGNLIVSSDNYANYYFGVSGPQSQQSGLDTYNAEGGIQQFGFTAIGRYNITKAWSLDLIGRYQRLVGDAQDSPLVDGTGNSRGDPNQFIFGLVGAYTF
jgi:outer membrane scaffolding protein for murein synthesis (MipA/OmpV family)